MVWTLSAFEDSCSLLCRLLPAPDFVELRQLVRYPVWLTEVGGEGEEEQVLAAVEDQAFLICLVYIPNKVRKPILVKLLSPLLRKIKVGADEVAPNIENAEEEM